ncbi:hypothetical protein PV327_005809 [Microctonus hyperodae]|uniref:Peptidase M12B domain-containing protein n=1 Tax=Microctonus hyperodae TaxID=165561 RepID=A0AA39G248_MICHY|nr:hypothetical protein PV327_005809 [Microctonus hyperodae]
MKIRNNGGELIELNLKRTEQYLVNKNLPVWSIWKHTNPQLIPEVMDEVGDFVMYHDIEHFAAVVYFAKSDAIFGVIDTRFYINGLPLSQLGPNMYHEVGGDYVKDRDVNNNVEHFHDFNTQLSRRTNDEEINGMQSSPKKRHPCKPSSEPLDLSVPHFRESIDPKLKIFYPEILVFVSNEIIESIEEKYPDSSFPIIVSQYIIYFNAVDLLLKTLATEDTKIHLNIAGIVVEEESGVFPYTYNHGIQDRLTVNRIIANFAKLIKKYQNTFPEDSFDFFFLSTKFELYANNNLLGGVSRALFDLYCIRMTHDPYLSLLGSIVQRRNAFADYVTASHEIGHLMSLQHDPSKDNTYDITPQCSAIMQPMSNYCHNCLRWSQKSVEEFKIYARTNRNRCFLLNHPRSLFPRGQPIKSLTPLQQCICYGFDSHLTPVENLANEVDTISCNQQLNCVRNNVFDRFMPLPLDGTPCNTNKINIYHDAIFCHELFTSIKQNLFNENYCLVIVFLNININLHLSCGLKFFYAIPLE